MKLSMSHRSERFSNRIGLVICLVLLLAQSGAPIALAQSSNPIVWTTPINLSQSGGVIDSFLEMDSEGNLHAIWRNQYAGFFHRVGDGTTWQPAERTYIPVPDTALKFKLRTTAGGRVFAFWISEEEQLYSSNTRLTAIAHADGWNSPVLWESGVRDFEIMVDNTGQLHLVYLRVESSEAMPAGIYVSRNIESMSTWSNPILIYSSPYLQTLTSTDTHLSMASTSSDDQSLIYIAWDNRPRRNLWIVRSDDRGQTWNEPLELVKPSLNYGFDMPYEIQIAAQEEQVLAIWKLGTPGGACTSYTAWSDDRGDTWSTHQQIFDSQAGCPQAIELIDSNQGEIVMFTLLNSLYYLLAWDWKSWSNPQHQVEFSNFIDPETHRPINFQDIRVLKSGNNLNIIGSDFRQSGDVWWLNRSLEDLASWFPSVSSWSVPEVITSEPDELQPSWVIADSTGNLHAFWNRSGDSQIGPSSDVIYAFWNRTTWSRPVEILNLRFSSILLHDVAINPKDEIYLALEIRNALGISEGMKITRVNSSEASNPAAWVYSEVLPTQRLSATDPQFLIDPEGTIQIIYAQSLNEDRGIYTIKSSDNGRTWSEITQIAEAVNHGWDMVGKPRIATSRTGFEAAQWVVYSLPPDPRPIALYGAMSSDDGRSWSDPNVIDSGSILWNQVKVTSDGTFHRLWLKQEEAIQTLWHQTSNDDGLTWSDPNNLLVTNNRPAIATPIDNQGRLHLMMISADNINFPILQHRSWYDGSWYPSAVQNLRSGIPIDPGSLSSASTMDGVFGAIYATMPSSGPGSPLPAYLYFTKHADDLPFSEATQTPISQPTQLATDIPPTNTPIIPTSTLQVIASESTLTPTEPITLPSSPPTTDNPLLGLIMTLGGLLFASIVVILARWILKNRK